MRELHINFEEEYEDNFLKLSCLFTLDGSPQQIWFKVPVEYAAFTTGLADPFLIGLLFPAMESDHMIVVHGKSVSRGLVLNLMEFQRAWHKWRPEKYSVVDIVAVEAQLPLIHESHAISAFTGGVDGAFILYENLIATSGAPFRISASLFIHGFDIPLSESADFASSLEDIRKVTSSIDIPLISIQSNLREFGDWNDTHAAAIIACLTLFNSSYQIGLLGSSHPYDYLRLPWGSNPITDPLLSSENFRVYNYGGGYSRIEKLKRIADWPACNEYLRVCTKLYFNNCGVCEKCLRTKLCYWTLSKSLPPTFIDKAISPFSVLRILAFKEQEIKDYYSMYKAAKARYKVNLLIYSLGLNIRLNKVIQYVSRNFLRNVEFSPKFIRILKRFFTT